MKEEAGLEKGWMDTNEQIPKKFQAKYSEVVQVVNVRVLLGASCQSQRQAHSSRSQHVLEAHWPTRRFIRCEMVCCHVFLPCFFCSWRLKTKQIVEAAEQVSLHLTGTYRNRRLQCKRPGLCKSKFRTNYFILLFERSSIELLLNRSTFKSGN